MGDEPQPIHLGEEEEATDGGDQSLTRNVGALDGIAIVGGIMIGTGIFASPGVVVKNTSTEWEALIVWVMGGLMALTGGLCYAELGAAVPKAGGDYYYLMRGLDPSFAFLYTWACFFCLKSGSQSIIGIVFSRYLSSVIFSDLDLHDEGLDADLRVKAITVASIVGVTLLNCFGNKWGMMLQKLCMVIKLLAFVLLIIAAIWSVISGTNTGTLFRKADHQSSERDLQGNSLLGFLSGGIGSALISSLWAYDGYSNLNQMAEEVINPAINIPLAIISGVSLVTVVYTLINMAYFIVLPKSIVAVSQTIAIDVAKAAFPSYPFIYAVVFPLLVSVSALGALNGSTLTGARIFFAAARDGLFPCQSLVQKVTPSGAPWVALFAQASAALVLLIPGNFENLVEYFGFSAYIFYVLVVVAMMVLRKREPDLERPFKVWPYPLIPLLFILPSLALVVSAFMGNFIPSLIAFLFLISGFPVYYCFFWRGNMLVALVERLRGRGGGKAGGSLGSQLELDDPYLQLDEDEEDKEEEDEDEGL